MSVDCYSALSAARAACRVLVEHRITDSVVWRVRDLLLEAGLDDSAREITKQASRYMVDALAIKTPRRMLAGDLMDVHDPAAIWAMGAAFEAKNETGEPWHVPQSKDRT
jgi:hypothetical protein